MILPGLWNSLLYNLSHVMGLGTVINKRTVQQCYSGPVALIYLCISTHSWDVLPCQLPGSHRSALLLLDYILGIFSHFQNFATHYWWKSRKGKKVISPPAWTNSNVCNNKLLGKAADSNTKSWNLFMPVKIMVFKSSGEGSAPDVFLYSVAVSL